MQTVRKIDEAEHKKILLNTLVVFDQICREHNILYSLAYGSMLGAVRHQGFIPWDDDIDIFMLRNEYNKFIQVWNANKQTWEKHYQLWAIDDEDNFFYGGIVKFFDKNTLLIETTTKHKVEYGIYLDIFILEDISSNMKIAEKQQKKYRLYTKLSTHFHRHGEYFNRLARKYSRRIPSIYFFREKLANITKIEKGENVSAYAPIDRNIYKRSFFEEIIYLPFEEYSFPVSKHYDYLLKTYYGNYMILPPEEERIGHKVEVYVNE